MRGVDGDRLGLKVGSDEVIDGNCAGAVGEGDDAGQIGSAVWAPVIDIKPVDPDAVASPGVVGGKSGRGQCQKQAADRQTSAQSESAMRERVCVSAHAR